MRAVIAIIAAFVLVAGTGCNTIKEAGQVAGKLAGTKARQPQPTAEQEQAQLAQAELAKVDARLQEIKAKGGKLSEAELKDMARQALGAPSSPGLAANVKVPADQEISVNLVYSGLQPTDSGKSLDFDFKALWGDYKETSEQVSMSALKGKGEASLNLDVAKVRVVPKIVSSTKGKYELEIKDPGGSLIGRFDIKSAGEQVNLVAPSSKYRTDLVYYHPERRLTGYAVYRQGTRDPELGIIFVGKGWEEVERTKKADLSKGYLFPEVDMVVLPKQWMEDNEMKDTCNTLKRGTTKLGGICYS